MKQSFGRSAALLAAIGVVAKLIGALYRIPLTNIVGAEGMGLYQLVFPVYTVLLALCGGGTTSAVSRTVARHAARGEDGAAVRVLRLAFIPVAALSALFAAAVMLLRNRIAALQGNPDAALCYLALAPSLLFSGAICVLRGYFQGMRNMTPGGISQLAEQTVKLAAGLALGSALLYRGVKYAVFGALLGVTASEAVAAAYLFVRYAVSRRKISAPRLTAARALYSEHAKDAAMVSDAALLRELMSFALPVTLGALVLPLTQLIDSVLVVNILKLTGEGAASATSLFGLLTGPVGTLINMPSVAVSSVAVAFLPTLTASVERGEDGARATKSAAKWIMLLVTPVTVGYVMFPERILSLLYSRGLSADQLAVSAQLLRIQAITVFYAGVLQLSTAVLQARGRAHKPVINLVIGACVKLALTPVLVRYSGVYGAAAATAALYGVSAALTSRSAYKCAPVCAPIKEALLLPLLFSAIGGGIAEAVILALGSAPTVSYVLTTLIAAASFAAAYGAAIAIGNNFVKKLRI